MKKTKVKTYFVALKRENNEIFIATSKSAIANFLNIHYITVHRHIDNTSKYICECYIIWKNVPIHKLTNRINNLK